MRSYALATLLILTTGALPAFAQDRTPPAGSYDALQPPIDQIPTVRDRSRGLIEGRSVGVRPSADYRYEDAR